MSISDEIQKLDDLRRNGALSSEEFEIAKRQVLEGPYDTADSDHLEDIKSVSYTHLTLPTTPYV